VPDNFSTTKSKVGQEPGTKEMQISVNKSNIKVPIDIQDALEILEGLWMVDGTVAQGPVTLDKRGYGFVQILFKSNTVGKLHILTIDFSFDNVTWYNEYISGAAEQSKNYTLSSTARYWRASTDAVAGAHTVDIVLGATQSS
jgi:hypothetical protein